MKVGLGNGNAMIEEDGNHFRVVIPSKKNIFIILFMCAWLGGWAIGEVVTIVSLFSGKIALFTGFWLIGWTVGGCFAILVLLWSVFGREVISSDGRYLTIEKRILLLRIRKEYDIDNIKNTRVIEQDNSMFRQRKVLEFYGMTGGTIHFDYGMKTVQFANNIHAAEGTHLLNTVLTSITNKNNC